MFIIGMTIFSSPPLFPPFLYGLWKRREHLGRVLTARMTRCLCLGGGQDCLLSHVTNGGDDDAAERWSSTTRTATQDD
jgi:hypothetical protein